MANEDWIKSQCQEIEALEKKHDSFNMHKKVKEAAGIFKVTNNGKLHNKNNQIIVDKHKKIDTRKDYIEDLFEDSKISKHQPEFTSTNSVPIMSEEVKKAISKIKNSKLPGPEYLHGEFFKLLDEESITWLTRVFNNIYSAGKFPTQWL